MRTKTLSLLFFLLPTLLAGTTKPTSIPFTTNSDGMVIVPATLGGNISVHVILDTGAGLDVLAPSLIEKLHGKPAGQFSGLRMTGERLDIALFTIPELSVGPVVRKDVTVGTWDVLDKFHLDGIISLSDFRQQPFTIDFANKVLIFEAPKSLASRRKAGAVSPLQFDDFRGIAIDSFSRFLFGNQTGLCEIDTGSPSATFSTRYMSTLGVDKDSANVHKHEGRTIAGAPETRYDTTLAQLALQTSPQLALANPHVSFSDIIYDCVVGVDFWANRSVTFDLPDRQLIVSK